MFDDQMAHVIRRASLLANNPAVRQAINQWSDPAFRGKIDRAVAHLNRPELQQAVGQLNNPETKRFLAEAGARINQPETMRALELLNDAEVRELISDALNREVNNLSVVEALGLAEPGPDGTLVAVANDGAVGWRAIYHPSTGQTEYMSGGFVGVGGDTGPSSPPPSGWLPLDEGEG